MAPSSLQITFSCLILHSFLHSHWRLPWDEILSHFYMLHMEGGASSAQGVECTVQSHTHTHHPLGWLSSCFLVLGSFSSQPGGLCPPPPPHPLNTAEDGNFLIIPGRLPGTSVGELGQRGGGTLRIAWGPHPRLHPQEIPWSVAPLKALWPSAPAPRSRATHSNFLYPSLAHPRVGCWAVGGFGVESPLMAVAFSSGEFHPRPHGPLQPSKYAWFL